MGNPGSWAVTLPDHSAQNNQMMQMLWQHNMQQQRLDAIKQQREMQRQAAAAKFVGDNLKDANYATGTAADPLINQMTAAARAKFAKAVHDNPNMDEGELEMQMQQDLGNISQYSAAVKAGRKSIEEGAQHYQQMPGLDSDSLKGAAINNLIFDTDANGKRTLKPLEKIDLSQDYLHNTLNANPDLFVQGDVPLMKSMENYKPKEGGDSKTVEHAGITTEKEYTDKIYPWQTLTKDSKGNATGLQMTGVAATLPSGQTMNDPKTGKPMQIVNDDTYNRVMTPGVQAQVRRDTNKYIQDNGYNPKDFPPGSEGYNILSKHILYNKMNDLTPSEFKPKYKQTDASIVTKMQLGIVDALGRTVSKADEKRQDELLNGNFGKIRQAVNLSPAAVQAAVPYNDPNSGKQYLDVTDFVGGFNTAADKKPTQYDAGYKQVSRVLVDPSNPGKLYTVEGSDGHIQEYDKSGIDAIQLRHAAANGHKDLSDVKTIISKIPINPDLPSARQARAEMEYNRRQQQANAMKQLIPFGQ